LAGSSAADGAAVARPVHRRDVALAAGYPSLMKASGITALPVTLLIDKAGRIADAPAGVVDKSAWAHEIEDLLREPLR
jgi:hypothetical protein